MTLFDHDIARLNNDPARHVHDGFAYINESARPEMENVRDLWESWFTEYHDDAKPWLRGRSRRAEYNTVPFELYVHALLPAHECGVNLNAPVPGKSTEPLPDFGISFSDGTVVDVEACGVHAHLPSPRCRRIRPSTHPGNQGHSQTCRLAFSEGHRRAFPV